jgi:protein-tyrosine phosphatase
MILFVCEGNVCRSVLAERVLAAALSPTMGITVGSAGTAALVGEPADASTVAIAARLGISLDDHRARQLTPDLLAGADMVLAATRAIRSVAVQLHPPAVKYSFTIRQMARILEATETVYDRAGGTGAPLVTGLARSLNREKGRLTAPQNNDDDVADPRGRPNRVHEQTSEAIVDAVAQLATALGGDPVAWAQTRPGRRWEVPRVAAG